MASNNNPPATVRHGLNIYMGGIGLQEFFVGIFTCLVVRWHVKVLKLERFGGSGGGLRAGRERWRLYVGGVYAGLGFITLRIIFRLIEFHSGTASASNSILKHEAYLYVFDGVPMLIAVAIWNVIHPGRFLVGSEAELPKGMIRGWFRKICCCCCCCCGGRKGKQGGGVQEIGVVKRYNELGGENRSTSDVEMVGELTGNGYGHEQGKRP